MSSFGYTPEVGAGLIRSPENREEAVRRILEEVGCKLRGLWYAFGEADGFALIEAPDNRAAAGIAVAIASSGAFRKFETTPVMTPGGDAGSAPLCAGLLPCTGSANRSFSGCDIGSLARPEPGADRAICGSPRGYAAPVGGEGEACGGPKLGCGGMGVRLAADR
jgi:uncharacterized protein with GYD domain